MHDKGHENNLKKGRHYADATRINSVLKIFGQYLVTATSTGVYRVQPFGTEDTGITNTCAVGEPDCPTGEQPSSDLTSCALFNITDVAVSSLRAGNGLLIGQFRLADGRTAVLLQVHKRSPLQFISRDRISMLDCLCFQADKTKTGT